MDIENLIPQIKEVNEKERDLVSSEKLLEKKIKLEEKINEYIEKKNDFQAVKVALVNDEGAKEKALQEIDKVENRIKEEKDQLFELNNEFKLISDKHLLQMHAKLKKEFYALEENKETRDNLPKRNHLLSKLESIEDQLEQNKDKAAVA